MTWFESTTENGWRYTINLGGGGGGGFSTAPREGVIFCWDIRGNYATKSTVAECVKRLCLGCVDELLAAFLEFPGVDGEAG